MLYKTKGGRIPTRTAKVCPKGTKCQDSKCTLSHKPGHLAAVEKRLKKRAPKGKGKKRSRRKGRAGAAADSEDNEDYTPWYEIEVDEVDEAVEDEEE